MNTIEFKIISKENKDIYQHGYVEVLEDVEEMPEWFYYDQQGFSVPRVFTHHNGVGVTATEEQIAEIEKFNEIIFVDEIDFINEVILSASEDEHRTYIRNGLIIIVNDGAKMECEIREVETEWNQYMVELIPRFNGGIIPIAEFMEEEDIIFDPYGLGDDANVSIENGHILFEISKDWFEGDEEDKEHNMKFINDEVECIFAKMLVRELGVYGIASNTMKEQLLMSEDPAQAMNEGTLDKAGSCWEQDFEDRDVLELYVMDSEDVEKIIKDEL